MKEIVAKRFDAMKQRFVLEIYDDETDELEHREFKTLEDFSEALDGNLHGADLTKYRYDTKDRSALISAGAYVDEKMIPNNFPTTIAGAEPTDAEIFYVTDLHLDVKFRSQYGDRYKEEGIRYMNSRVYNLTEEWFMTSTDARMKALAVGGDVAADMDIVRSFYEAAKGRCYCVLAVLGNHEFWDSRTYGDGDPVDGCVRTYTEMLAGFRVHLLHNSLFINHIDGYEIMSEEEILKASADEIRAKTADSILTVFGTTGFAALDDVQNAESGMYRGAITTREQEAVHSARADTAYRKLMEAIPDQTVLVISHMPLRSWTTAGYVSNWSYIHGHEHRNDVTEHDGALDYGDNQIGYGGVPKLKNMLLQTSCDMFRYISDGIYTISTSVYRRFMDFKGMHVSSCKVEEVTMLKRDGLYMFLTESKSGLRILDGGNRRIAYHDIQYYYDNIPRYAEAVRRFASGYDKVMREIATNVKRMGGDGRVHGCIVDLDYYNHLFLNPFDGKLTPYYATSMRDKYVYPSVMMLIEKKCPALKEGYKRMVKSGECNLPAVHSDSKKPVYYPETDIYEISRQMYKIQHLTGRNIIRQWDDAFLDLDDPEANRRAARALIGDVK